MSRFWFVIILLTIFRGVSSIKRGYYTIVVPQNVRLGSVFHVSLTLNSFHKSCWFNISLTSSFSDETKHISGLESIEIMPGTTKLVQLQAPALTNKQVYGNLEIVGYRGIISKDSALIFFESDQFWALIQTNKPKYKPGELIEFRIICIDQLKRPAKLNEDIVVEIYDDQNNLLRTISDARFLQGVFRSEFQLSDYPLQGENWKIKVLTIDNRLLGAKTFEVGTYVLPKFNVVINYPKKATIDDQYMVLEISTSYFYGEPVKGNLTLIVTEGISFPYLPDPLITYNFQINGQIEIALELKTDLQLIPQNQDQIFNEFYGSPSSPEVFKKFHIEAIVIDDLSEEESRTAIEVEVYRQPYKLELKAPGTFNSEPLLKMKVEVLIIDLEDKSVLDTNALPIYIVIGCRGKVNLFNYGDTDVNHVEYKNEIDKNFAIIQVTNKNYSECYIYAKYGESKSSKKWVDKKMSSFDMEILTDSPREGEELEIKITNSEPFEEFSYEIVSKGDIVESGYVNKQVVGNRTTHNLRFNLTASMVPKITIYVHLIKDMKFIGQLKDVLVKRAFENSIEIFTRNETYSGEEVSINVKTDEGSYVGLMGLDRSALQDLDENYILNNDYVNLQLSSANSLNFYDQSNFNGRVGAVITLSNVFPPAADGFGGGLGGGGFFPLKRVRKLFPESWLFLDFKKTPAGGLNILETVPESITTWVITGFSINSETGLTFTKNSTNLRVFKEFFVSMDLPSLVKNGEAIEVPIYISNFMNEAALTSITIETDSEDLLILDKPEDTTGSKPNISKLIAANESEKILIFLKPLKHGHYNVTVKALSPVGSDGVQKLLKVQAQGIPYAMSKTYLVHLPKEGEQKDEISIDIPENAVSGSQRVEVSVVGDVFGPLMKTLQKLARVPYGNSQENTELIASNSLVLKYLKVLNYSNPSLESKLRHNIELGYQNQLSFIYLDGSFGSFEQKDERTGDIWHTVFSLWALKQANEFVRIDPWVINRGLYYLASAQQENGCFKSESGPEEDVKITVFGLMVFLMNENSKDSSYNDVIKKGLEFLYNITENLEYSPISSLSVYALLLGKHEKAKDHLMKLTPSAHLTNEQMLWTRPDTLQAHLETTARNFIKLFESQEIPERSFLQIVRGLIVSKKEESSIHSIVALKAMITFVEKLFLSGTKLSTQFKDDKNKSVNFEINSENSRIFQSFEISPNSRKISIQSNGHGFAVVDVRYYYNILPETQTSSQYVIKISTRRTSKRSGFLMICSSVPQNKLFKMEIDLQSGYKFTNKNSREDTNLSTNIKAVQINDIRNKAIVYLELTQTNETCTELNVLNVYKVFNSKPSWITVYDVYEEDRKSAKSFTINDF